jgi:DNA-binding NarL/FixJ family response regulator
MTEIIGFILDEKPDAQHAGFPINLTPREREVLLLLCEGLPNKLISRRLNVSVATVKCHVASVLRSLNAATRLEAVAIAHKLGLVKAQAVTRPQVASRPLADDALANVWGQGLA